jgi:hypothetical protein
MRIEVGLPSKWREQKLIDCIASINDNIPAISEHNLFVYIYFSEPYEYEKADALLQRYKWVFPRLLPFPYEASKMWNYHLKDSNLDIFFWLTDDIVLHPLCIKNAIDCMEKNFPDYDGVIGLRQENLPIEQALPTAFAGVGCKFLERFPDKALFCPEYKRFYGDREIYEYSNSLNKFSLCNEATLIHKHPNFNPTWYDKTHDDVRENLPHDRQIYTARHNKGYLWGHNFTLIGDNNARMV